MAEGGRHVMASGPPARGGASRLRGPLGCPVLAAQCSSGRCGGVPALVRELSGNKAFATCGTVCFCRFHGVCGVGGVRVQQGNNCVTRRSRKTRLAGPCFAARREKETFWVSYKGDLPWTGDLRRACLCEGRCCNLPPPRCSKQLAILFFIA